MRIEKWFLRLYAGRKSWGDKKGVGFGLCIVWNKIEKIHTEWWTK